MGRRSAMGAIRMVIATPGRMTGTASAVLPPKPIAARAAAQVSRTIASTLVASTEPDAGWDSAGIGPSQMWRICWSGSTSAALRAGVIEKSASTVGTRASTTALVAGSTSQRLLRPLGRRLVQRAV